MRNSTMIYAIISGVFLVPFIFKILIKEVELKEDFETHFEINIKWLRDFSLVFLIISCVLGILINLSTKLPIFVNILLSASILGFILIAIACRFKIVVNGNEITYTPSFSKSKKFNMGDITLIKTKEQNYGIVKYVVYIGKKKIFSLSNMLKNVQEFINMARANNIKFEQ